MKKCIIIFCIVVSHLSFAQIKDYFIPRSEYLGKTFLFEGSWANEKGEFRNQQQVTYFLDASGNYKKYIIDQTYRYNVLFGQELRNHRFFNISSDRVAMIYSYTEGLSEELKDLGLINGNERLEIVLKPAPANWVDKTHKDETTYYSSVAGKLTTEYGFYDNCIIVTVKSKDNTGKSKWVEKGVYKFYYAFNLGLVKQELYYEGKLEGALTLSLVDTFSQYSFAAKEKKERERLLIENKKKQDAAELEAFLKERPTKIYNYAEIEPSEYNELKGRIEDAVYGSVTEAEKINLNFELNILLSVDLNTKSTSSIKYLNSSDRDFENELTSKISGILLRSATIKGYPINASCTIPISFSKNEGLYVVKFDGSEVSSDISSKIKQSINSDLLVKTSPAGTYNIKYSNITFNNNDKSTVTVIDFKGLGGAQCSLLSVVVPGAGDHFVKAKGSMFGKNISPWVTTVGSLALVGSGVYIMTLSDKNYALYHSSTNQSDIDKYYNLANDQNKIAWTTISVGAIIWLVDIFWVAKQGGKNTKESNQFKSKVGLAFKPILINNKDVGLSVSLKFK